MLAKHTFWLLCLCIYDLKSATCAINVSNEKDSLEAIRACFPSRESCYFDLYVIIEVGWSIEQLGYILNTPAHTYTISCGKDADAVL